MFDITLQQLMCLEAVVCEGGFQAAAQKLGRTHSSVFAAVRNLEAQLGFEVFDRSGYRVALTAPGQAFFQRSLPLMQELRDLRALAAHIAVGEESGLHLVLGECCKAEAMLTAVRRFFANPLGTRPHLHFEALGGPLERLLDGDADLIVHHVNIADLRLETVPLHRVRLIPVLAPGFLPSPAGGDWTLDDLKGHVQCLLRDTARHTPPREDYIVPGARRMIVGEVLTQREVIRQGLAWGHLPDFLVREDLRNGRLQSLTGRHLHGIAIDIVAARLRTAPHGVVANRFWAYLEHLADKGWFTETPLHLAAAVGA